MAFLSVAGKTGVEWTMDINNKIIPCHLLMYVHLLDSPSTTIITKYGPVSMPGIMSWFILLQKMFFKMFLVPKTPLYTTKYKDFLVDKNVRLVCGWGKETDLNHLSIDQIQKN